MAPLRRSPGDSEIAEMHRILLKVAAHEPPSSDEVAFLRALKIELMEQFDGPNLSADLPDDPERP
ncbi:MAG TPA: hypothetical protein VGO31_03105 [Microbacteriaceae bacterium]|jgi:hypothetical protein|nr:hypothetical protein [Microbacteriaceae bacterium]